MKELTVFDKKILYYTHKLTGLSFLGASPSVILDKYYDELNLSPDYLPDLKKIQKSWRKLKKLGLIENRYGKWSTSHEGWKFLRSWKWNKKQ